MRINITPGKQPKAVIAYVINKKYWNNGYATEAATEILKLGFEVLELIRIEALYIELNSA